MDINGNSEKWALVIDDLEGMRAQLRMSLSNCGFAKLHVASSIKDALKRMEYNRYDIILCDYALGDGTDGQQFLEYLRSNDLISRNTIFVMITAEQAYEKVVSASECTPDDYLLKPFTAAQFDARLERLLEKQAYFSGVNNALDAKDWTEVIIECDKYLVGKDKYYVELCKVKACALEKIEQPAEAAELYRKILAVRAMGWAKLGLARMLVLLGQKVEAQVLIREVLTESPRFMAAYDFLGQLLVASGDKHGALDILQKARKVAPGTMSRIRELSSVAVSAGKPEIAEEVMKQALHKHRYSPERQAADFAVLSKALIHQGRADEALSYVTEAQKEFKDPHSTALLSASESVAHHKVGNHEAAELAIKRAMAGDINSLSVDIVLELAEACFAIGREGDAAELIDHAIQNNYENESVKELVHTVLVSSGRDAAAANDIIAASQKAVITLNNEGVKKAQAGQLDEAIELLFQATTKLPNNLQILSNVTLMLALDLQRNGYHPEKFHKCNKYRTTLVNKDPAHPKLTQIDGLLKQVR